MSSTEIALRFLMIPACMLGFVVLGCIAAWISHRFQVQRYLNIARRWNGCVYDGGWAFQLLYVEIPMGGVRARLEFHDGRKNMLPFVQLQFPFPDLDLDIKLRPAERSDRFQQWWTQQEPTKGNVDLSDFLVLGKDPQAIERFSNSEELFTVLREAGLQCGGHTPHLQIKGGELILRVDGGSTSEDSVHEIVGVLERLYLAVMKVHRSSKAPLLRCVKPRVNKSNQ